MKPTHWRLSAKRRSCIVDVLRLLLPAAALLSAACGATSAADPQTDDKAAQAQKTREALQKVYALADGEDLKCIQPPYPTERKDYLLRVSRVPEVIIDRDYKIQIWKWENGQLRLGWVASSPHDEGMELLCVIEPLTGARRCELEGEGVADLEGRKVRADFIVRKGASKEKLIEQLEGILRRDFKLALRLRMKEVEREVVVVSGTYRADAPAGYDPKTPLQLYGKLPIGEDRGVKSDGGYSGLLDQIGVLAARQVISEVKEPPDDKQIWYEYDPVFRLDTEEDTKALLKRVVEQTGLTIKQEKRRVKVLFIDRIE